MEVVTGDRQSEFPQPVAPFPEAAEVMTAIDSVNLPPQKLRPIRRSPPEDGDVAKIADSNVAVKVSPPFAVKTELCDFTDLDEYSSSSDEESEGNQSTGNQDFRKKRKRKMKEKMEYFMEGLVMRIMQKQEEMNNQLIEMLERRERERVIREEAWRQQETERTKRDEELRTQENSRNLALISFIQSILGQDPIPQQPWTPNENINQDAVIPSGESNLSSLEGKDQDNIADADTGTVRRDGNKRWPEAEVRALITLRTGLQEKFGTGVGSKCPVWEEISEEMRKMGYERSGKKCKEKWENINKYFRRSVANGKKEGCRYFEDLDKLYQKNGGVDSQLGS